MSQQTKKSAKQFDDYESGNGPRPPVPGEESNMSKMTTEGISAAAAPATTAAAAAAAAAAYALTPGPSNALVAVPTNRTSPPPPYPPSQSPQPSADSFGVRVSRWQKSLENLLADKEGLGLLFTFVKDGGEDSKHFKQLNFYFACEGLKVMSDMQKVRRVTRLINDRYLVSNIIEAPPELRTTILQILRNEVEPQPHIFDDLQRRVEQIIEREVYPAFLTSDLFIEYTQSQDEGATAAEPEPDTVNVFDTQSMHSNSSGKSCGSGNSGSISSIFVNVSDGMSGGGAGATYSRMNVDILSPLINASNLQTLHEDSELKLNAKSHSMKPRTARPMPKLTEDLLLATQKGRLEVRPQGAVGYTYSIPFNSSYNPVSRQDSERQSCSSAGQTSDSEVNSKDGKPYMHRRQTPAEDYRKAHMNPQVLSQKSLIKPLNQGLKESDEPVSKTPSRASYPIDPKELFKKLQNYKREQEKQLENKQFAQNLNSKLNSAQPRLAADAQPDGSEKEQYIRSLSNAINSRLPRGDVDVQSILDQHVSSVFSPRHTPGSTSPKNLQRSHYRSNEMSSSVPDFAMPPIRHSRSIPENASFGLTTSMQHPRRPPYSSGLHRCPSQNIDSGISLYSADYPYKPIDQFSEEHMRRSSKDDSRRSRKQLPLPQQQLSSMSQPMLFQPSLSPIPASSISSHHSNTSARHPEPTNKSSHDYTFAHYHFIDEKIPYRIKIPSRKITLKLVREHLPRKGNFRYFFQTACDDPENPVVQEEVVRDSDMVPIYDGKVICNVKLCNEALQLPHSDQ